MSDKISAVKAAYQHELSTRAPPVVASDLPLSLRGPAWRARLSSTIVRS